MKRLLTYLFPFVLLLSLNACNGEGTPTPTTTLQLTAAATTPTNSLANVVPTSTPIGEADASPAPTGSVVDTAAVTEPHTEDDNAPSPTTVTDVSTGSELTALQALAVLRPKALAWQADAQLGLLSNARPGQQKNLLGDALGKPDINEPTPGGKGRNCTLVAFSPSSRGAMAISMEMSAKGNALRFSSRVRFGWGTSGRL